MFALGKGCSKPHLDARKGQLKRKYLHEVHLNTQILYIRFTRVKTSIKRDLLSCHVTPHIYPIPHICGGIWRTQGTSAFMRTWLHLFVCMHRKFFNMLAAKYFNSKGLTLENLMEGILDGRKGDVLLLHGLCLLIEQHAWVHLKDKKVWSSLHNPPKTHTKVMDQCNLHLAYLGQGIHATLIERPEITTGAAVSADTSISANEIVTIHMLTFAGLGVGLSRPKAKQKDKTPVSATTSSNNATTTSTQQI